MNGMLHAPAPDRVRANTWPPVNDRLDSQAQLHLRCRRMGVCTRQEVKKEKFALKALRGDFENLSPERQSEQEER
jgi:hypothetical protein